MSRKYPWHPASRPPPADASLAASIALIGRVGKCLQTALDEIQKQDDAASITASDSDDGGFVAAAAAGRDHCEGRNNKGTSLDEVPLTTEVQKRCLLSAGKKRNRAESSDEISSEQSITHDADETAVTTIIRMDESISKSIMEEYGNAVATTNFDVQKSESIDYKLVHASATNTTAPAAMLRGEIDHYNRIGDRWRIVVKNAVIKPRKTTIITNGMTGHSLRRRLVLDWDDEGSDGKNTQVNNGGKKWEKGGAALELKKGGGDDDDDAESYHFKGTVQVLAYDAAH